MALLDSVAVVSHVVFGGLWTGAVVFTALLAGGLASDTASALSDLVVDRLRLVSRSSAVITLLSGGYMATGYSHSYFTSSTRGLLLSTMVVLWLVLMVTVEIGASRVLDDQKSGRTILGVAGIVALLLLLDVGLLVAGI
ncbi:putative membrane protein [Halanaeroarchaeum sp. HSR-CO]|uniref:hypothetical protein n=1 Tax=Halanaeroarchaeum sp. HSR-CO TaxID=2866382 RepID=UPI00217E17FF|nr:hypothetical protein [Halanaeroarchaeum sp. HSR-CO]UWG48075.1 putative membrane protein [Halanaeroarchaeum sp. HSR-CO]